MTPDEKAKDKVMTPEEKAEEKAKDKVKQFNEFIQSQDFQDHYPRLRIMMTAAGNPNRDNAELRKILFAPSVGPRVLAHVDAEIDIIRQEIQQKSQKIVTEAIGSNPAGELLSRLGLAAAGPKGTSEDIEKLEFRMQAFAGIRDKLKEDIGPSDKMTFGECAGKTADTNFLAIVMVIIGLVAIGVAIPPASPALIPVAFGILVATAGCGYDLYEGFKDWGKDREIPNNTYSVTGSVKDQQGNVTPDISKQEHNTEITNTEHAKPASGISHGDTNQTTTPSSTGRNECNDGNQNDGTKRDSEGTTKHI